MDNEDSSMATTTHHVLVGHHDEEEDKHQETCCNGRFIKVRISATHYFVSNTTLSSF